VSLPLRIAATLIAVLALAGCGGGSSSSTPTTAAPATTATTPVDDGRPAKLSIKQLDQLRSSTQRVLSASAAFVSQLNQCIPLKHRTGCVKRAARPAEAIVLRSVKLIARLKNQVSGDCQAQVSATGERLGEVTDTLRPVAQSATTGDFTVVNRLVPQVQDGLRSFAAASTVAQQACAA